LRRGCRRRIACAGIFRVLDDEQERAHGGQCHTDRGDRVAQRRSKTGPHAVARLLLLQAEHVRHHGIEVSAATTTTLRDISSAAEGQPRSSSSSPASRAPAERLRSGEVIADSGALHSLLIAGRSVLGKICGCLPKHRVPRMAERWLKNTATSPRPSPLSVFRQLHLQVLENDRSGRVSVSSSERQTHQNR